MSSSSKKLCATLLERASVPVDSSEPYSIRVHNQKIWDRVVAQRQLGLGEAYIDGWFDCDALDEMLTRLVSVDATNALPFRPSLLMNVLRSSISNNQTRKRASLNAKHHYNIGNDLYERMLDKRMIYSCAYWLNSDDLDSAQEAKLDLVCQKLRLEPGMRVLDIGCGWGGFLEFAASRYGVTGVGISPADEQVRVAAQRCADLPVEIKNCDYRDLQASQGRFDRVLSIGMLEHVGPKNLRTFFAKCEELLNPSGLMLHHTIGGLVSKDHSDPFFDRYIFPGGVLPTLAQISASVEPNLVIEDVHNFGLDYDRTLMAWSANLGRHWASLSKIYDERFRRMWHFYLMASAAGFRARSLQLWQVVFRRKGVDGPYLTIR
ncbi:MAG: cyclopropane fatty acyl phospholipid synthase [Actinobacteria bacterium]|nr:cyclopropane fatty acyl phospholipid synthase [Actinomycetota bacterium]